MSFLTWFRDSQTPRSVRKLREDRAARLELLRLQAEENEPGRPSLSLWGMGHVDGSEAG